MTSEEYANRVKDVVLSAGARMMEREEVFGASAGAGLYQLALGGAAAVRGKGRQHEADANVQAFEKPDALAQDWITEARDELTDCAAWLTGASEISDLKREERDRYIAYIMFHLALAIDALDTWMIWERTARDMARSMIRPEDQ